MAAALYLQLQLVDGADACGGRAAVRARGRARCCQQACGAHTEAEPISGAKSMSSCCKHECPIQICFLHSAGERFLQTAAAICRVADHACTPGLLW